MKLTDLGSNPAAPIDQDINLAGKLTYDSSTDTLIINLAAAGLTLSTDAYQIELFGSGSPVITSPQGIALDGENTVGDTSTGAQLALPSGNGYPGGNFFDSFIINTTPPSVLAGSLKLDPASDTNIVGDDITSSTSPTFDGTVSEPNAQLVPLAGQTAILDIGIAVLDQRRADDLLRPDQAAEQPCESGEVHPAECGLRHLGRRWCLPGDRWESTRPTPGWSRTRTRWPICKASTTSGPTVCSRLCRATTAAITWLGCASSTRAAIESNPNDPNAQVPFVVDTTPPTLTFTSPTPDQVITSLPPSGQITFTVMTSENIDQTHFTAASIQLINAGPDGILGTADDVTIPIDPSSIKFTLLDTVTGGQGREEITFSSQGTLTNNLYQVTLLSTGAELGPRHRGQHRDARSERRSSSSPCRRFHTTSSSAARSSSPTRRAPWAAGRTRTRRSARP